MGDALYGRNRFWIFIFHFKKHSLFEAFCISPLPVHPNETLDSLSVMIVD